MSSPLLSQGVVFATALAVSAGTILLLDQIRGKYSKIPSNPHPDRQKPLRSCLSSGERKGKTEVKKKKKRVKFADDVELDRRDHRKRTGIQIPSLSCGNEILEFQKMPRNRAALYSGKHSY